jgi:hypothetical protein
MHRLAIRTIRRTELFSEGTFLAIYLQAGLMAGMKIGAATKEIGELNQQPKAKSRNNIATYIGFLLTRNTPSVTRAPVRPKLIGFTEVRALRNPRTAKTAKTNAGAALIDSGTDTVGVADETTHMTPANITVTATGGNRSGIRDISGASVRR